MAVHAKALAVCERALRRRGAAAATREAVADVAQRFLRDVGISAKRVRRKHVVAFLAGTVEAGRKRATTRAYASRLRVFFAALTAEGYLANDPAAEIELPPARQTAQLVVARQRVQALLAAASASRRGNGQPGPLTRALGQRNRALIEVLYGLGLRRSEAAAVLVTDLNLGEGELRVRRAKRGEGEVLPLTAGAVAALSTYLGDGRGVLAARLTESAGPAGGQGASGAVFLSHSGKPLGPAGVWGVVRRVAEATGDRLSPHVLRRSLATHLVEEGVSVEALRQLLGHARLETTARYVQVDGAALRSSVETLGLPGSDA